MSIDRRKPSKELAIHFSVRGVPINCYKLMFFRHRQNLSIDQLAKRAGISPERLRRVEVGNCSKSTRPTLLSHFERLTKKEMIRLEGILQCPGELMGGQEDDFSTRLKEFCMSRKPGQAPDIEPINSGQMPLFIPAAIVFDFDGTLTLSKTQNTTRTTWEALWIALGYDINECSALASQFFDGKISHEKWCEMTLEKFRARGLTRQAVNAVGKKLDLIEGFADAIRTIHERGIPMYIVSGSIVDVVAMALGEHHKYFKLIHANVFTYANDDSILNIVGTRYDFKGKGEFVKRIADELKVSPKQIVFVGNSINDEQVKPVSGATTILVNPRLTVFSAKSWDKQIREMNDLRELYPHIGVAVDWKSQAAPGFVDTAKLAKETIDLLEAQNALRLGEYTVIGRYRRHNAEARSMLIDVAKRIQNSLSSAPLSRENYLIAAPPGSGKTFFIEELADANKVRLVSIDLNKHSQEEVLKRLESLKDDTLPTLCLLDEIDGKLDQTWPFTDIYKSLDLNDKQANPGRKSPIVFVAIGSSTNDPIKLRATIANARDIKGPDFMERFSKSHAYNIHIPSLDLGDSICVYVSKVLDAAKSQGCNITHVNRLAAYHAVMSGPKSPRQIELLASQAVKNAKLLGKSVVHFDHHFDSDDQATKFVFLSEHSNALKKLHAVHLEI